VTSTIANPAAKTTERIIGRNGGAKKSTEYEPAARALILKCPVGSLCDRATSRPEASITVTEAPDTLPPERSLSTPDIVTGPSPD
jgi:hypothetical protein